MESNSSVNLDSLEGSLRFLLESSHDADAKCESQILRVAYESSVCHTGGLCLNKLRLILTVLTIVTVAAPLLGVVLVYRDNLLGLVVPPILEPLITRGLPGAGLTGETSQNVTEVNGGTSQNVTVVNGTLVGLTDKPIELPQNVTTQYDPASRTVVFSFNFTNPLGIALTLDSLTTDVSCTQHSFPLGQAVLVSPVSLGPNKSAQISLSATWTEEALAHFDAEHTGEKTISVDLTNTHVSLGGISLTLNQKITVPDVPLS